MKPAVQHTHHRYRGLLPHAHAAPRPPRHQACDKVSPPHVDPADSLQHSVGGVWARVGQMLKRAWRFDGINPPPPCPSRRQASAA